MYKLLVVDDEDIIRHGITDTIRQELDSFELFEAANGFEALECMEREAIDAMILDFKMPKMDGMTLLRTLMERDISVLTVLLTGYEDFNYAKLAMDYGALKFILKPAMPSEIRSIVQEVKGVLDQQRFQQEELDALREHYHKNIRSMREKFFEDLLHGEYHALKTRQHAGLLGVELGGPHYQVALLGVQKYHYLSSEENIQLVNYSIGLRLAEMQGDYPGMEFFQARSNLYILLFNRDRTDSAALVDLLYEIKAGVEAHHKVQCAVGVGRAYDAPEKIKLSYAEALETVRHLHLTERDYVAVFDDTGAGRRGGELYFDYEAFVLHLKSGRKYDAIGMVDALLQVDDIESADITGFYLAAAQIAVAAFQALLQVGGSLGELQTDEMTALSKIYSEITLSGIRAQLSALIRDIAEKIEQIKLGSRNATIQKIKAIVGEEYAKPLSLKYIAEKLYMNPVYLGQLFKNETGSTLNDYINKVRVSKAKLLLKTSNSMIYEVAEKVGFSDAQYFSTVFKKIVGISPKEFKDI